MNLTNFKKFRDLINDWTPVICLAVSPSNHNTRMFCVFVGLSQKRPLWSKAWCCVFEILLKFDAFRGGGVNRHCRFGVNRPCRFRRGGVNRHCRFGVNHPCRFRGEGGKSSLQIWGKSSLPIYPQITKYQLHQIICTIYPPQNRQGRFTPNLQWRFTPPQIVLGDLMC